MISAQSTAATNSPGEERLNTEVYFLLTPALIGQAQSGSSPGLLLHTVSWRPGPLLLSDGGDKRVRGHTSYFTRKCLIPRAHVPLARINHLGGLGAQKHSPWLVSCFLTELYTLGGNHSSSGVNQPFHSQAHLTEWRVIRWPSE